MIYFFLFLTHFLINSQSIDAPSAKQLCLKEAESLHKILTSSQCQWVEKKKNQSWPEGCHWPLQCQIQDSTNINFQFCPNGLETKDTPWDKVLAQGLYQNEERLCKDDSTHLKRCRYVPEQKDGIPVGDDPNYSSENCKIHLKQNTTSGQK